MDNLYYLAECPAPDDAKTCNVELLRVGKWSHPAAPGGTLDVTPAKLEELKSNFDSGMLGKELPVNINHREDDRARGWIKGLSIAGDRLVASVEVVDDVTAEAIRTKQLKYASAELAFDWKDPESGRTRNVLKGLAFTNRPFIKNLNPVQAINLSDLQEETTVPDDNSNMPDINLSEQLARLNEQMEAISAENEQLKKSAAQNEALLSDLLAEQSRHNDQTVLAKNEANLTPARRKLYEAALRLARNEELMLHDLLPQAAAAQLNLSDGDANRAATVRDALVALMADERPPINLGEVKLADGRPGTTDIERIKQRAADLEKTGVAPGQALRQARKEVA